MIALSAPTREIQIAMAIAYSAADAPGRVALVALALVLSWPSAPWLAAAQAEVARAEQEEQEARQWIAVAPEAEKQQARQAHFQARQALEAAKEALSGLAPDLHNLNSAARVAVARLDTAGVPLTAWWLPGNQLLQAWVELLAPAPEAEVQAVWAFTVPPLGRTSGGGSNSQSTTPATPSAG